MSAFVKSPRLSIRDGKIRPTLHLFSDEITEMTLKVDQGFKVTGDVTI